MNEQTPLTESEIAVLQSKLLETLHTCYDPEIPVNIYDLGLIYEAKVDASANAYVKMTLTAPGCPVAGSLTWEIKSKIEALPGIKSAKVEVVWDPPWNKDRMSDAAKLQLGL